MIALECSKAIILRGTVGDVGDRPRRGIDKRSDTNFNSMPIKKGFRIGMIFIK